MGDHKPFEKRVFLCLMAGVVVIGFGAWAVFWGLAAKLGQWLTAAGAGSPLTAQWVGTWIVQTAWVGAPLLALYSLLVALVQWRIIVRLRPSPRGPAISPAQGASLSEADHQAARRREQRLFVHLLSRMQREGRLMDFLAEDLNAYGDEQIGAAARGVHTGCRRVVEALLAPQPVLTVPEDRPVTLTPSAYDPQAVTLTGRVTDHPPFDGIVRHAGWRAGRVEIPLLADDADPAIIAPAEVEVQ